jgi:hypothetical protein
MGTVSDYRGPNSESAKLFVREREKKMKELGVGIMMGSWRL